MNNDPFDIGNEPLKFDSSAESTASSYNLNKQEICELEDKASSGDSDAAFRLYQYYFFVALEHKESEKWLHRSAEFGNPRAINIIIQK